MTIWRGLRRNRPAIAALGLLSVVAAVAVFAPLLAPHDEVKFVIADRRDFDYAVAVIDEHGDGWTDTGEQGVSNGPFVMDQWNHDQDIILVPNPNYTTGDPVTLTRAEYRIFEDQSTQAYIAFENDELDYAAPEGPGPRLHGRPRTPPSARPAPRVGRLGPSSPRRCRFLARPAPRDGSPDPRRHSLPPRRPERSHRRPRR